AARDRAMHDSPSELPGWPRPGDENTCTLGSRWAATRMGVGAAPAESPPAHARTARGIGGARPASPGHGRGPRPHPLAVAHASLAWRLAIVPRTTLHSVERY